MEPEPGTLLVAAPDLLDPNFAGSVVLLLDVDEDGALGVILNRPSGLDLDDVWPQLAPHATQPDQLFVGGPVSPEEAMAVCRVASPTTTIGWRRAFDRVGVLDPQADPDRVAAEVASLRVYAGYAGWGHQQLLDEVAEGAWIVVPSRPEDLFRADVTTLRRDVLRRQPGEQAWAATRPADPRMN